MKPILKWQYDQLVKELMLLQEHQADPHCPCQSAGEMCVRKHLMTIEAYAQETLAIEEDPRWREKLDQLSIEAEAHRDREEAALCGKGKHVDILDWSRLWRKEFETYSLACELDATPGETCPLPV
jgi:hypothetical protein